MKHRRDVDRIYGMNRMGEHRSGRFTGRRKGTKRAAAVCNLVNLAYYHGQTIKWDPKKENFADNTGKPEWLGREYRAPWKLP
jgi:hypothetical protein